MTPIFPAEEVMEDRYSNAFNAETFMLSEATGSRYEMLQQERQLVEQFPGPLNFEPWRGSQIFEPQPFTLGGE
jgi:hypothetical protein